MYEETEKLDEALEDFKKVLTFDSSHTEANHAVRVIITYLKHDSFRGNVTCNKNKLLEKTFKDLVIIIKKNCSIS